MARTRRLWARAAWRFLRGHYLSETGFLFDTIFGDPGRIGFGEGAAESGGFEVLAVGGRAGLLSPGVIQITGVDRVEPEIVDEAKYDCPGIRGIAGDGESYPALRSFWDSFLEK